MPPVTERGGELIHAITFLRSWGWKKEGGVWRSPPPLSLRCKDTFVAYEKAVELLEEGAYESTD